MTRLFLITFLLLGIMSPIEVYAEPAQSSVTLPLQKSPGNGDDDEDQHKDKRIPSAPIYCIINFENNCVENLADTIIVYEVCDAESGETTASFINEFDFVEYLSTFVGEVMIRLSSTNYTYIGYLSL